MKAKFATIIFFVLMTLTLMTSIAAAEDFQVIKVPVSYDFLVSTLSPTTNACLCGETSFPVTVTNIGSYTTIFTLSSDDSKLLFSQDTLTLQPGEHKQVMATRDVSCSASGTQDVSITVTSSFYFSKQVKTTYVFGDCQAASFAFDKVNLNASVCKPFNTTLFITNTGSVGETYTIEPLDGVVTLSAGSVYIPAGKTASILASYTLPCDVYGHYTLRYDIAAQTVQKFYRVEQSLSIPYEYYFDLRAAPEINFCAQDNAVLVLELENKNDFTNDFKFDVDVPSYATVNFPEVNGKKAEVLTVEANTIVPINITLSPQKYDVGHDIIEIDVTDKYGKLTKELSINVSTSNCYDLSTAYWTPKTKYVCGYDRLRLPFSLFNNGEKSGTISLVTEGSDYVYFDETSHNLDPFSAKEVMLSIDVTNNSWGEFPIVISSYSGDELLNTHSFNLVTQPKEFCYNLEPRRDDFKVRFDQGQFSIPIRNDGTRYGSYLVDLQDDSMTLDSLTESVDLGSSEKSFVFVNITQVPEVGSKLDLSLTFVEVNSMTVFTYPITVEFVDYPLLQRVAWTAWDAIYYAYNCLLVSILLLVLILIFTLIIIFRSYKRRTFKTPKTLLLVIVIVLILLAVAIYIFKGLPYIYTSYDLQTNSTTHLLIEEDVPLEINLQNYFFDPDGDIVQYGVSSIDAEVLSYEVNNASLILSPAKDFEGQTMLMLFATDSYGMTAESRQIRVDVLPVEDYTTSELYLALCIYLNFLLLVVLAILLFFTFAYKKRVLEYQRTLNEVVVVRSENVTSKQVGSDVKSSKKLPAKKTVKSSTKKSTKKSAKRSSKN